MPKIIEMGKEYDVTQEKYDTIQKIRNNNKYYQADIAWKEFIKSHYAFQNGELSFHKKKNSYNAFCYYFKDLE